MEKEVKKYWQMPKQELESWLEALRSKEYAQCNGILHDIESGGYCCLGVFARVQLEDDFHVEDYELAGLDNISNLSLEGIEALEGDNPYGLFTILTDFNDGNIIIKHPTEGVVELPEIVHHNTAVSPILNQNFEFIADFIEKYVEAV